MTPETFSDLAASRHSVRDFWADPVPPEVIEEILENEGLPATVHPNDWARVSGRRGTPVVSMSVLQRSREE